MFRNLLNLGVFLVGLVAVCWIGVGYMGSNPLGVAVAALIAAGYLAGALELHRYRQATTTLANAVADSANAPSALGEWLGRLHPSLRNAVRMRVEGERVALPAPTLTPYLVGLLVLLGMLGTLLGMMATLRGTGLALESATDLQAMRGSLAAPVKGLGFAFGTSIAGVASSAMLGLLSALCRRERLDVVQQLDAKIASTLRVHSKGYQREESFKLLQQQTALMPALVEQLQTMMTTIEQHSLTTYERQLASHESFHARTEATYARMAASVEKALKESVTESARAASATLQPVVEATMQGLASETASLHGTVTQAVQRHLDGLSAGFEATTTNVADIWNKALAEQRDTNETLAQDLRASLDRFTESFDQRSTSLVESVSSRLDTTVSTVTDAWNGALSKQEAANASMASQNQQALATATTTFEAHAAALVGSVQQSHTDLQAALESRDQQRLAAWTDSLGSMATAINAQWEQAGEQTATRQQAIFDTLAQTANDISAQTKAHASDTITEISRLVQAASEAPKVAVDMVNELAARDEQRLAAWSGTLDTMATALNAQWDQVNEQAAERQQAICDTLAQTARDITAQTQAHASETIAEISSLVQAASEAPKVAADVVAELRQKLSDSMVRDTAMLEERSRLLATLETLLDAVNHASTEQRTAVNALVTTTADLLDRVGTRFTDHIEGETGKLETVAAQITGSAVEVASLGDAFGAAVQSFGQSNDALMERLELIAGALDKSLSRSDEQLAYYVAQAKEVVDLSVLSQKQIIEDMQRLAERASAGTETA
ncbi:DUF802 domain-containing protein [Dyella sp. C11]|uniref:DUF802 domain-containing protein n=1 Tax=Dyella sp. C11 TaxID=2126991 RepID=UPI000D64155C|nr:DUF802 domain-containing protein [Dyella sp. C11]